MKYLALYVLSIITVNYAFERVPPLVLPGGDIWSPVALVVGLVFVVRDYAQREIGHAVLPAMLFGGAISWFLASPNVALASVCAFFAGELLDWAVYTFTGRPFSQRVLLSSAIGTPVDSAVFLSMAGLFSLSSLIMMTISKMAGALVVFFIVRRREGVSA
ncbi:MAG: VUT family protein [Desulfovibrio sp.]|nr:VUT family protein [Desulfovibrio sp.]